MHILPLNFMILKFFGLWRPSSWSFGWKSVLYYCYTIIMLLIVYTFTMSECIELLASFDNVEEFAQTTFLLLTMIGVCGKVFILAIKREEIIDLTNVLRNDICRPRNVEETKISYECERNARSNAFWYTCCTGTTASVITLRSLILDMPKGNLPFKGWLPYRHDSTKIGFFFAYLHQLIAHAAAAMVCGSFDTFITGLMMQTCAQIKILKYRIEALPQAIRDRRRSSLCDENDEEYEREGRSLEHELMTKCIRHHVEIFQFAKISNEIFGRVVFLQFVVSSLVICVSVFEISKMKIFSSEFVAIVMYLTCMLLQIFIFCFYGGEMTLQSVEICDAVYRTDWSSFSIGTKKSLTMMMMRALRPITFTCGSIIILSLDSFNSLIKLSYSVYNFLQQSTV